MNKKKGFTLIELLVVIAIIALLLSIIMPSLNTVKQRAGALVCMTNLSSLGKGMFLYAMDYDDYYPLVGSRTADGRLPAWGGGYPVTPYWDARIMPYLYSNMAGMDPTASTKAYFDNVIDPGKSAMKTLLCPGSKTDPEARFWYKAITNWTSESAPRAASQYPRSYKMNALLGGHGNESGPFGGNDFSDAPNARAYKNSIRTSSVVNSSATFLLVDDLVGDGTTYNNRFGWTRAFFDAKPTHDVKYDGRTFADTWHKDGSAKSKVGRTNAAFTDGHVDKFKRYYTPDEDETDGEIYWRSGHPDNKYRYKFGVRTSR